MKINKKIIDIFIILLTFAAVFIACVFITHEAPAHNKASYFNVTLYPPNHEIVGFRTTHIDFPSAGLIEFYDMDSGDYVCLEGSFMVRSGE